MKIIDLLNKIANGEKVNMIKFEGQRYKYIDNEFVSAGGFCFCGWLSSLNDEVEIIEEDKKIEKLTPFEAPFLKDDKPDIRFRLILDKINEIIDKLNKEE